MTIEGLTPEQNAEIDAAFMAQVPEVVVAPTRPIEQPIMGVSNEPVKTHAGALQNSGFIPSPAAGQVLVPQLTYEETERNVPARGKNMVAVRVPEGVTTTAFYNLLSNSYALYLTTGTYSREVLQIRTGMQPGIISKVLASQEFKRALELRGVVPSASGLTTEQDYVLLNLTNPSDGKTLQQKLKAAGVSYTKYQAWMKQPVFRAQIDSMTQGILHDNMPAIVQLSRLAGQGDLGAIKYQLELNGTYDPNKQQSIDILALMSAILEIISKHVQDREVLSSVAGDMGELAKTLKIGQ